MLKGMDMETLVSVIIPVYNVEQYLDECLKSIVQQSYRNLEIIIVNDGATDNSDKKCEDWAEKDGRIQVLHQENKGLSAARNAGLNACRGEWIVFVDSDDVLPQNAIEIMYSAVTLRQGIKIAQGCSVTLNHKSSDEQITAVKMLSGKEFLQSDSFSTAACGKIYHNSVWTKRRFREGIIHEDYDIMYRILYDTPLVVLIAQTVYLVRDREGSITRSMFSDKKMILLEIDEEKIDFFRDRKETYLLEQAYKSYYSNLLHMYKLCKKKEIVRKYRKNFKHFIRLNSIGHKTKWKLFLCYFFPGMWEWRQ